MHPLLIFCCALFNLPILEVGYTLAMQYGPICALLFITFGNAILVGLGLLSFAIVREYCPPSGNFFSLWTCANWRKAVAVISTTWILCWIAFHFHLAIELLAVPLDLTQPWQAAFNIVLGAITLFIAFIALRQVDVLHRIAGACLMLFISFFVLIYFFPAAPHVSHHFPLRVGYGGIPIIIAIALPSLLYFPSYWHSTNSISNVIRCLILFYGVTLPLIEGAGVVLAQFSDNPSALEALLDLYPEGSYFFYFTIFGCLVSSLYTALFYLFLVRINSELFFSRLSVPLVTYTLTIIAFILSFYVQAPLFSEGSILLSVFLASTMGILLTSQQLRIWRMVPSSLETAHRYRGATFIAFFWGALEHFFDSSLTDSPVVDGFFFGSMITFFSHFLYPAAAIPTDVKVHHEDTKSTKVHKD